MTNETTTGQRYRVRRIENEGERGGIVVEWQTFDTLREDSMDGGWCQSYARKRDAAGDAAWLNENEADAPV